MEGGDDHPLDQGGGLASEAGKKAAARARGPGRGDRGRRRPSPRARRNASVPSAAIPPDGRRDAM